MASLSVDIKEEGQGSFKALLEALASAPRVEALAVRNCGVANMRALADALLLNTPALASIRALDLSADGSAEFDKQWQLGGDGVEELRHIFPHLKNLTSLNLACKPHL
jgi:hypothetical protein